MTFYSRIRPICLHAALWTAALMVCLSLSFAEDEKAPEEGAARAERLEQVKGVIDQVVLETADEPPRILQRTEHALVRFTNPQTSGVGEGVLFLWLDGERPAAAVSMTFRDQGVIWWELTSLSDQPLRLRRDDSIIWTPKASSLSSMAFKDAPPPAETATVRLIQMRNLARQFTLRENRRDQWQDGRLLPQPLYRWADSKSGIVDGAMFSFAEATDPELLLLIEAHAGQEAGKGYWNYSLAKMTSSECEVRHRDELIWSGENFWRNPGSPEDAYLESRIAKYGLEQSAP